MDALEPANQGACGTRQVNGARLKEKFMCPACIASAGVVVGSAVSTGGLTALVVKVLRKKKGEQSDSKDKDKE